VRANPKRRYGTYRIFLKHPTEVGWTHVGDEWATSQTAAIRKFRQSSSGIRRGDKFAARKVGDDQYNPANPRRVKGAKIAGGRAVSLRNFTGRVIRKRDGTVQILGRTRR
jgi:hypothetical protein